MTSASSRSSRPIWVLLALSHLACGSERDPGAPAVSSALGDTAALSAAAPTVSSALGDTAAPSAAAPSNTKGLAPATPTKKSDAELEILRKEGMAELNALRFKEALLTGRTLIREDPKEATGYFILGAALQSTGHWVEGQEQLNECVRKATKGPIGDCKAAGGHP